MAPLLSRVATAAVSLLLRVLPLPHGDLAIRNLELSYPVCSLHLAHHQNCETMPACWVYRLETPEQTPLSTRKLPQYICTECCMTSGRGCRDRPRERRCCAVAIGACI